MDPISHFQNINEMETFRDISSKLSDMIVLLEDAIKLQKQTLEILKTAYVNEGYEEVLEDDIVYFKKGDKIVCSSDEIPISLKNTLAYKEFMQDEEDGVVHVGESSVDELIKAINKKETSVDQPK